MAKPQQLQSTRVTTTPAWTLDAAHSSVEFSVKHLMFATVRGRFRTFGAELQLDEADPARSQVTADIDVASIDTGTEERDNHLRSGDFFLAAEHPKMTFRTRRVEPTGPATARILGDLTIRGTTKEVVLEAEHEGTGVDPYGQTKAAFVARTTIDRQDYGLAWNQLLETGGVLVGDKVRIEIRAQFVKPAA